MSVPTIAGGILMLIFLAIKWYLNQPPKAKFPRAELDPTNWHDSLMRAKTKVSLSLWYNLIARNILTSSPIVSEQDFHLWRQRPTHRVAKLPV